MDILHLFGVGISHVFGEEEVVCSCRVCLCVCETCMCLCAVHFFLIRWSHSMCLRAVYVSACHVCVCVPVSMPVCVRVCACACVPPVCLCRPADLALAMALYSSATSLSLPRDMAFIGACLASPSRTNPPTRPLTQSIAVVLSMLHSSFAVSVCSPTRALQALTQCSFCAVDDT